MIVILGGAGRLGAALAIALSHRGLEVSTADVRPLVDTELEWSSHTVLESDSDLPSVIAGAELLIHAASIHPWREYSDRDYLRSNVESTWMVFRAAEQVGLGDIILTSSVGAAGVARPGLDWPVRVHDRLPIFDIYSQTKRFQEDIAQTFASRRTVRTMAIRPAGFIPLTPIELGFVLTRSFTILQEVVDAHTCAVLKHLDDGWSEDHWFRAAFVTNRLPYTVEDGLEYERTRDMVALVARYWPEARELLVAQGYAPTSPPVVFDLEPARRLLGWQPSYGFDEWFADFGNLSQSP